MNKLILKIARKKFKKLFKKYDGFINVIVDDWRGYRFIFDTVDVRKCQNDCKNCVLFNLLKKEKNGFFSAGLYPANKEDKEIFGPQNFLNCKTIEQYKNCYINFLNKKLFKKDVLKEVELIKGLKIIYLKNGNRTKIENDFKRVLLKIADSYLKRFNS